MKTQIINKSIIWGFIASVIILSVYFALVGLISGIVFAVSEFSRNWYFILGLSLGFGLQVGLYSCLRQLIKNQVLSSSKKTVAITGTTSTLSMLSCCAHYLVNIIPILGVAGAVSVIAQYQKELFGVGLLFNFFGIVYIGRQIIRFNKQL